MEPKLSSRIQTLSTSQTIAMAERAAELKAEGVDIISLSLGEPDFNTPEYIVAAAKKQSTTAILNILQLLDTKI
jgi:aspartate aminotransferase